MSGTRDFSSALRGVGRNTLDVPVAALAALAVAFAAFAIPPAQLADLVGATGLPQLLPAAEPPLGAKARIGLGLVGAILVFALVYGLLRSLDRKSSRPANKVVEAPRVRRRDSHPDAPSRRPISASLEFGEPGPSAAETPSAPAWLSPAEWSGEDDPVEEPEVVEPAVADSVTADQAPTLSEALPSIEEAVPESIVEPEAQPDPRDRPRSESIAELMVRLEQGLARRQPSHSSQIPQAVRAASEPSPSPADGDDRLQSAIDSLQRLASRQG